MSYSKGIISTPETYKNLRLSGKKNGGKTALTGVTIPEKMRHPRILTKVMNL
jgi:hypothetical protein